MRSKNMPTPRQLRLGGRRNSRDLRSIIAAVAGDPAYLHEMESRLGTWSRKQLEKAVGPLVEDGTLVRYGAGTRYLYATTREVPEGLEGLSSVHIRLLQYMPMRGAVELAHLEAVMSETGAIVRKLCELQLLVRISGNRDIVALASGAWRERETLGEGLALPALGLKELRAVLGGRMRQAQDIEEIDRIVQEMSGARQTAPRRHPMAKKDDAYPAEKTDNLYAYLLLRTDLPSLGRGKSQAHAMHAGNEMTHRLWVKPLLEGKNVDPRVAPWHAQGGGFGTTITLGKAGQITRDAILRIVEAAEPLGLLAGLVDDTSYPYIVDDEIMPLIRADVHTREPKRLREGWLCCREEITAAWLMGDKDDLTVLLARFDLAPND